MRGVETGSAGEGASPKLATKGIETVGGSSLLVDGERSEFEVGFGRESSQKGRRRGRRGKGEMVSFGAEIANETATHSA